MKESLLTHPILKQPIESMAVSDEFKEMARVNNFETLKDILLNSLDILHTLPSSGFRMLKELGDILAKHGLSHLLED